MKTFAITALLAALGAVTATPTTKRAGSSLPHVTVKGNAFYADGKRFFIRGLDYQPGGSSKETDPLGDVSICGRDIPYFKQLGINVVRVYAVDNSKNHDECMQQLSDAGIYLVLDVNTSKYSLNRADPGPSYNTDYLQSVFATVQEFAKYDNTLAFFSGNEVINDEPNTDKSAPYIKAVTRDIKNYLAARGLRKVPVGYSAADVAQNRMQTAAYMNCGSDDARSDFFAFNDYSFCNSDFQTSGWDQKVKNFTDYGLPIFLSEYGCIKNRPRKFEELDYLMSDDMSAVYSGGLMYEWSNEENNYGLVTINGDSITKSNEFNLFKNSLKKNPSPTGSAGAASTTHSSKCPAKDSDWNVNAEGIPSIPKQAAKYFKAGAGTGPGIKGPGSQTASDSGTSSDTVASGVPVASSTSDDDEDSAAYALQVGKAPFIVSGLAVVFGLMGTLLL